MKHHGSFRQWLTDTETTNRLDDIMECMNCSRIEAVNILISAESFDCLLQMTVYMQMLTTAETAEEEEEEDDEREPWQRG